MITPTSPALTITSRKPLGRKQCRQMTAFHTGTRHLVLPGAAATSRASHFSHSPSPNLRIQKSPGVRETRSRRQLYKKIPRLYFSLIKTALLAGEMERIHNFVNKHHLPVVGCRHNAKEVTSRRERCNTFTLTAIKC